MSKHLHLKLNSLKRKAARFLKHHPSSYPYISADTFRKISDHVHDLDKILSPRKVQTGDVVFVSSGLTETFFTQIHPHITQPYILITHYDDKPVTEEKIKFIDEKIIHWFSINVLVDNPKVTPLPLGLENQWYYHAGDINNFKALRKQQPKKRTGIFYKFSTQTNIMERPSALDVLQNHPLAETFIDWKTPYEYLKILQTYKFTCSPPGSGEDCHRTWEAMYLGVIPIVKRSVMTEHFANIGLPLHLVDDWKEITELNTATLDDLYKFYLDKFNHPALWAEYWFENIKQN